MAGHPRRTPGKVGAEIASLIREAIARRQITQKDVAIRADISTSQLSLYLRALRSPTVDEFHDLCVALQLRPEAILAQALRNVAWRENNQAEDGTDPPIPDEIRWSISGHAPDK